MLEECARALYGEGTPTRFRPGYYPFTEPSVAFDVGCLVCGGSGCPACKRSGWITILGAGMVHPTVLRNGGIDPDEYQGYAWGMGPDRMTMLRYGINDIRQLWGADLRFLEQFTAGH
jgi:phenylalanyl-tRNA synthetase alpha chain